ncbi:hypothetical protein, partial [Acetobacter persici]|uniref:hypothetical protein n=1 Tax=Acetobacter persici TaxID=1076596 RepID=UPI0039E8FDC2
GEFTPKEASARTSIGCKKLGRIADGLSGCFGMKKFSYPEIGQPEKPHEYRVRAKPPIFLVRVR